MSVLTIIVEYYLSKSIKVKRFDTYKNCLLLARYQKVSAHSSTNKQAIATSSKNEDQGGLSPRPYKSKNIDSLKKTSKITITPMMLLIVSLFIVLYYRQGKSFSKNRHKGGNFNLATFFYAL